MGENQREEEGRKGRWKRGDAKQEVEKRWAQTEEISGDVVTSQTVSYEIERR